ncbi:Selenocysteine insertion sequence-binding protein 2-like, partial [Quaeritorhiza haematococci]
RLEPKKHKLTTTKKKVLGSREATAAATTAGANGEADQVVVAEEPVFGWQGGDDVWWGYDYQVPQGQEDVDPNWDIIDPVGAEGYPPYELENEVDSWTQGPQRFIEETSAPNQSTLATPVLMPWQAQPGPELSFVEEQKWEQEDEDMDFDKFLEEVQKPVRVCGAVKLAVAREQPKDRGETRSYVDQLVTEELDTLVREFLSKLKFFSDRQKRNNPIKAKSKKRIILGLREVVRSVQRKKCKCVIMARNIEPAPGEGGLDILIKSILDGCSETNSPVIFSMTRRQLTSAVFKNRNSAVSCVGILDYDGAEDLFKNMMR